MNIHRGTEMRQHSRGYRPAYNQMHRNHGGVLIVELIKVIIPHSVLPVLGDKYAVGTCEVQVIHDR